MIIACLGQDFRSSGMHNAVPARDAEWLVEARVPHACAEDLGGNCKFVQIDLAIRVVLALRPT
jgi:hypothetical protein